VGVEMNERIRELHNQACRLDMDQYPNAIPDGERIQQKFAELIVQECAEIALTEAQSNGNFDTFNKIVKHFGVSV
jgi:hypothetical protein